MLGWLKKAKARAYNNIGAIYYFQGNYPKALDHFTRSLKLKRQLNDKAGIARTYGNIALIYYQQGNYPKALDLYRRILKLFRQLNDKAGIARTYNNIANIYEVQGNYPKALDHHRRSAKLSRQLNDKAGIASAYNNIAIIYDEQGNYPKALDLYTRSLKLSRQLNDKAGIAHTYNNIAIIYEVQGNYPKALDHYRRSLKLKRQLNDKAGIAGTYGNIANIYYEQGNYPQALDHYRRSLKLSRQFNDKAGIARTYTNIGSLYTTLPDSVPGISPDSTERLYERAMELLQKSLQIKKEIGAAEQMTHALNGIGKLYLKIIKLEGLSESHSKWGSEYAGFGFPTEWEPDLKSDSHASDKVRRLEGLKKAVWYYEQSAQIADSIGAKPQLMEAYKGLAEAYALHSRQGYAMKKSPLWGDLGGLKAYEYHVKYAKVKEEVFNEDKRKDMGRMEMAHEYELEKIDQAQKDKEAAAARASRDNAQYIFMLIGVFAMFTAVFFLANILMPDWLVNLVSWIPFVMLFELTLVYTDPYIEALTGGQPFYKFLINTAIAVMLFFVQHYFQNKLRQRMYRIRKVKAVRRRE